MRMCMPTVLLLLAVAQAQALTVINPSFEQFVTANGSFPVQDTDLAQPFAAGQPLQGWSAYDPQDLLNDTDVALGVVNPQGTTFFVNSGAVPDGHNAALTWAQNRRGQGEIGIQQTLADTLSANTRYTLSVEVGNIASGTGLDAYAGYGFFDLDGFPGYRVQLLAGDVVIAEDFDSLTIGEGQWATSTVQFDVGAAHGQLGQALGIRLINRNLLPANADEPGIEVDFDHVRLDAAPLRHATQAIPEPSTAALAGISLLTLLARRRQPARR